MSREINNQYHAFPMEIPMLEPQWGLTKREYFASLALQGLVTQFEYSNVDDIADTAVQYADALIASLNKQPPQKGGADE